MERASELIGTATMICWILVLGPVGAILLAFVAYAMANENIILGVICALTALSPVFLTVAWGIVAIVARAKGTEPARKVSLEYLPMRSDARAMSE